MARANPNAPRPRSAPGFRSAIGGSVASCPPPGHANRNFLLPRRHARQQENRKVGAHNQHHHAHCGGQRGQRRPRRPLTCSGRKVSFGSRPFLRGFSFVICESQHICFRLRRPMPRPWFQPSTTASVFPQRSVSWVSGKGRTDRYACPAQKSPRNQTTRAALPPPWNPHRPAGSFYLQCPDRIRNAAPTVRG